jgi:hypothetical protein
MPTKRAPLTKYPCDLHCHTTRSDGYDSPQELIDHAAGLGMVAIAITDHDITPPDHIQMDNGQIVDIYEYARSANVILVPGYEFSTDTWVDEVHICGYFLDWDHPDLVREVEAAASSKSEAYFKLCMQLTDAGMPVDWETDVLFYLDTEGMPAWRLPKEVQRKHIFQAMAARGYAENWRAAKLMVRDNAQLNVHRRKIDPAAAIALIHRCGGIAILAHPYLIDEFIEIPGSPVQSRFNYIEGLITAGLDGIEARYTYDKTTYKGLLTPAEIESEIRSLYGKRLQILSGGSDYHADEKQGGQKPRRLGERGLTVEEFITYFGDEFTGDPHNQNFIDKALHG